MARTTKYTAAQSGTLETVHAVSDCSASALYLPLAGAHLDVRLTETPLLRWRWRIERSLDVAHEREKSGDDFAARVYVMFAFDTEHATIAQRLRHRLGEALYRRSIPGNAIDYVWTSHEPRGARWDNPYAPESKMASLGAGPMLEWRSEEVDVETDYRTLFGTAPPPIVAVAVMTDSDDSCQRATAEFADLGFTARQGRRR